MIRHFFASVLFLEPDHLFVNREEGLGREMELITHRLACRRLAAFF